MAARDLYEVLEVPRNASEDQIRSAYRRLARQFHPDVNQAADAGERFKEITEACTKVLKERGFEAGIQHGPCHWVGRGVHDPNGNAPLRPGSVFVIEPGLYFPARTLGVRIEDTYLVREDGALGAARERQSRAPSSLTR